MRIVYLGSPQGSIYPLQYLLEQAPSHYEILAVVSQPAKVLGRGRTQYADPPLAAYAKTRGMTSFQPEKASDPTFQDELRKLEPDLMITCAYGQILNSSFLSIPRRGTINIHPSLLPQYRGATPIQSALLDGLTETGISILFTIKELDAGNLILQERTSILPHETTETLSTRLFQRSGPLLLEALKQLQDPSFEGLPQDPKLVSFCKKIKKDDGLIDWNQPAQSIVNRFRAFYPWPGSYTFLNGKRIVIEAMEFAEEGASLGKVGELSKSKQDPYLRVCCIHGNMRIHKLKPEGSRSLTAQEFWNGLRSKSDPLYFTSPTRDSHD